MRTSSKVLILTALMTASLVAGPLWAKNDMPAINAEGMELVKDTKSTTIYSDPGADLGIYTAVMLSDASVSFKKNWKRDYNRDTRDLAGKVKDSDMDRIKEGVATIFKQAFTEQLTAGGYKLVDEPGEFVLRVKPAIVDLDVYAPDIRSASRSRTYSESVGEMTLNLELYDSLTNDKIVSVRDHKRDLGHGYAQWRTSGKNKADAQRMMNAWAKAFTESLDEAKASVGK
ncbi:MAG: DUF3313 family protein [Proteobacteria bacterium]|nr:DUF3313 family protein [Pseudomonadota bacterium]